MATSGEVLGNGVNVSGGHQARIRIEWQLAGQNTSGNFSTINWQSFVDFFLCDAELDNGHVNSSIGALWGNGGRVYNFAGNFTNHTVTLATGSFNIGHNSDGTQSLEMDGNIAVFQSGTTSGSGNWSLPTIPRFANITGLSFTSITDVGFNLNVNVDAVCNQLQYSLDGGSTFTTINANFTSYTVPLSGLLSNHTYGVQVIVQRADSGLTTTSGVSNVTTGPQNNFFGLL